MAKVKITVVKKVNNKDLFGDNPPAAFDENMISPECKLFEEGQEIILDSLRCPADFCGWAYADIQKGIAHVMFGGSYPWMKEKETAILCCSDGLRPVVFKLEKMAE